MSTVKEEVKHKHFRLNETKLKRAQKMLGTRTATETIERALDEVIAERERNRIIEMARDRFLKSGVQIRDVFGRLDTE